MMTKPRAPMVFAAVFILLGLTGCGSASAPPSPTPKPPAQTMNWPQNLKDFRFRWSANPGIPLDTGWAVPLRAYLESLRIIFYTLDRDSGYPGMKRATAQSPEKYSAEWKQLPIARRDLDGDIGNVDHDNPDNRFVGNEDLRILRAEPIPSGFRAFVCDATYGVFKDTVGSRLAPLYIDSTKNAADPDLYNMTVLRIEFSDMNPGAEESPLPSPQAAQQGPLPAPRDDVFGPWLVTGSGLISEWLNAPAELKPGTPEYDRRTSEARATEEAMRQQCLAQYPLNAEQRKAVATTVIDNAPLVQPAAPGWPDASK